MNQNYWARIRAHYKRATPAILACEKNEWALDAYAWEALGAIHFTPIEEGLWHDIRAVDVVLYPQYPVLNFFVDFANPKAKVAIECDGAAYHDASKDAERDAQLRAAGWTVYRISGRDCRDGVDMDSGQHTKAREFIQRISANHNIGRA